MSLTEAQNPALTTTDILGLNEIQLIQYLERNGDVNGGFDISGLIGVEDLSKIQQDELGGRLR